MSKGKEISRQDLRERVAKAIADDTLFFTEYKYQGGNHQYHLSVLGPTLVYREAIKILPKEYIDMLITDSSMFEELMALRKAVHDYQTGPYNMSEYETGFELFLEDYCKLPEWKVTLAMENLTGNSN